MGIYDARIAAWEAKNKATLDQLRAQARASGKPIKTKVDKRDITVQPNGTVEGRTSAASIMKGAAIAGAGIAAPFAVESLLGQGAAGAGAGISSTAGAEAATPAIGAAGGITSTGGPIAAGTAAGASRLPFGLTGRDLLGAGIDIFGGIAGGRQAAANRELLEKQLEEQRARDQAQAELERSQNRRAQQEFALKAPGTRMSTSVRASLLGNYKPSTTSWGGPGSGARGEIPTFGGGVQEGLANLDPKTRDLITRILADELDAQLRGGSTGGREDFNTGLPDDLLEPLGATRGTPPPTVPPSGGNGAMSSAAREAARRALYTVNFGQGEF